ncbi:hypothetical protein TCAL_16571 [Tigriopus californicus]|uniref:Uncharacterized protein n=1 Tax=Tigriopus californicus TaxID=6832 RepID=A0A553NBF1_TIGCA|nr:hypothetical protein TCAL_16571 [Tigriopus californicus]
MGFQIGTLPGSLSDEDVPWPSSSSLEAVLVLPFLHFDESEVRIHGALHADFHITEKCAFGSWYTKVYASCLACPFSVLWTSLVVYLFVICTESNGAMHLHWTMVVRRANERTNERIHAWYVYKMLCVEVFGVPFIPEHHSPHYPPGMSVCS